MQQTPKAMKRKLEFNERIRELAKTRKRFREIYIQLIKEFGEKTVKKISYRTRKKIAGLNAVEELVRD